MDYLFELARLNEPEPTGAVWEQAKQAAGEYLGYELSAGEFRARFVGVWESTNTYARDRLREEGATRGSWASPMYWPNVDQVVDYDRRHGREFRPLMRVGVMVTRAGTWDPITNTLTGPVPAPGGEVDQLHHDGLTGPGDGEGRANDGR